MNPQEGESGTRAVDGATRERGESYQSTGVWKERKNKARGVWDHNQSGALSLSLVSSLLKALISGFPV